jgi:hypothetical protein
LFAGQAKLNRQRQFKPPPGAPLYLLPHSHMNPLPPLHRSGGVSTKHEKEGYLCWNDLLAICPPLRNPRGCVRAGASGGYFLPTLWTFA